MQIPHIQFDRRIANGEKTIAKGDKILPDIMNRKISIFVTILLLSQIASFSFNQSPTNREENEQFTSDEDWSSSGRNNTTGSAANCLILNNASMNQTYYVTVDLVNICSSAINYPGINATTNNSGVSGLHDIWWYVMGGNNSTIQTGWQLLLNQSVQNGTIVTINFEATILNCGPNNSWSHDCPNSNNSSLSYQFTVLHNGNNSGPSESITINPFGYTHLNQSPPYHQGTWASGADVGAEFTGENLNSSANYSMTWALLSGWSGQTTILTQGNVSWTTNSTTIIENVSIGNLSDGNYMFQTYLYSATGSYLDHDMSYIQVGNNTGGNNTGGNNTDCGNNTWYTQIFASIPDITFDLDALTYISVEGWTECEVIGTNYTVQFTLWQQLSNTQSVMVDSGMENWTATGVSWSVQDSWDSNDLGVGYYFLNVTLMLDNDPNQIIDTAWDDFEIIDNNNTGNNGTNVEYNTHSFDYNGCVESGGILNVRIFVFANASENVTVNWGVVDSNNLLVMPWLYQNVTTSSNGSAYFDWSLNVSNLSNGIYEINIVESDNFTFETLDTFDFQVGCTGCGYDSSFIDYEYVFWADGFGEFYFDSNGNLSNGTFPDEIVIGTIFGWWVGSNCLEYNSDYLFNYTITNDANSIIDSDEEYFSTGMYDWYSIEGSVDYNGSNLSSLPTGEYCITINLYMSPYGSSDLVFTITQCINIISIDDWDGCGTNSTYLEHMQTVSGNPFVQQNLVFLTVSNVWVQNYVECLLVGENYTMQTNVTTNGNLYYEYTNNFTINQFSDTTQWDWETISNWQNDIPAGNYCVNTTIHLTDGTYTQLISMISTVEDCFAVVEFPDPDDWWINQDNGTGNGTGSPNDPILPDGNCTDLNNSLSGLNLTNSWNMTDCENGTGFWFNLTVNGTGLTWYDPVYAVGYDYVVISGPNFASVVVPPGYGDNKYDLYLWDGTEYVLAASDLDALTEYWFTDEGGVSTTPSTNEGVSAFSIRGLEISAKIDPEDPDAFVTGLTFAQDPNEVSEVILSMTPITVSDQDDDGILDEDDNCVINANPDQADADDDGIGDVCEDSDVSGDGDGDGDAEDPASDGISSMSTIVTILALVVLLALFFRGGNEED